MLLEKYRNAILVGVDFSSKMLEQAHQKLNQLKHRVTLVNSDFKALPSMGPFELVYSILAVHHLSDEDKQELFRKIWAQLQPNGIFILIDVVKGGDDRLTEIYAKSTFPFDEVDKPSSLMEQLEWLKNVGFCTIDVPWKDYKPACVIAIKTG